MAGSREPEQLLELLRSAALELKTAKAELETERARVAVLERQVAELEVKLVDASAMPIITRPVATTVRRADEVTGVPSSAELVLESRVRALQEELEKEKQISQSLREDVEALEAARDAAAAAEPEVKSVEVEIDDKASALENELALVRARRDALNVELARVENDRKLARARVAELEVEAQNARKAFDAEKAAALEAETKLRQNAVTARADEVARHQATTKAFTDARDKVVELENALAQLTTRVVDAEAHLAQASTAARQALAAHQAEWAATKEGLEGKVSQLTQKLQATTAEWRHVEKQYEKLHKEMLVQLDQRDDARREVEQLRAALAAQKR